MKNTITERLEAYRNVCADCGIKACSPKDKCRDFYDHIERRREECEKRFAKLDEALKILSSKQKDTPNHD